MLSEAERNLTKDIAKKTGRGKNWRQFSDRVTWTGTTTLVQQVLKEVSRNYRKNLKISYFHRSTSSTKVAFYCGVGKLAESTTS